MDTTPRHFIIEVPLYKQEVIVFYHQTPDYVHDYVLEDTYRVIFDMEQVSMACTATDPEVGEYVVYFNPKYGVPSPGIIAHEFFHVSTHICEDIGIKLNIKNQEAVAYVMTHLINAFYAVLDDKLDEKEFNITIVEDEDE